ncbi:hypothetical protein P43SY_009845 [Pythium insidiosum]|uniref:Protein-tyrosine-phosphatase n=1 Tax=Pythium insidiosum TaxID=114742 RepID=A0AAD5QCN7_PYTIN|nr:hypothetical protein P43SY_009845 [Pythium insidiosum]
MPASIEVIEVWGARVYLVLSASVGASPPLAVDGMVTLDVAAEFPYQRFARDFGPLSLAHLAAFSRRALSTPRLGVLAPSSSSTAAVTSRTNAVCLLACWRVWQHDASVDEALAPFQQLSLMPFHDATHGDDSFGLTVRHVVCALRKALHLEIWRAPAPTATPAASRLDVSWITPRVVAFAGPVDPNDDAEEASTRGRPSPEHFVPWFQAHRVALVVRLNRPRYRKQVFIDAGIHVVDLHFRDGSCPSDGIVGSFLDTVSQTLAADDKAVVAVHCKAGLGRTGTLVACYLMQQFGFSADEAIGWLRLCRPGSVVGPQQQFLRERQSRPLSARETAVVVPVKGIVGLRATMSKSSVVTPGPSSESSPRSTTKPPKIPSRPSSAQARGPATVADRPRGLAWQPVDRETDRPLAAPAISDLATVSETESESEVRTEIEIEIETATATATATATVTAIVTESAIDVTESETENAPGSTNGTTEEPTTTNKAWSSSSSDRHRESSTRTSSNRSVGSSSGSSSGAVAFSRPATYDPRLARRALGRYDDDDDAYDEGASRRRQQLKDELGLSDDDAGPAAADHDEADGSHGRRDSLSSGSNSNSSDAVRDWQERYHKLLQELKAARDSEQRVQDSLSKLQLLSKSQTAILKTTMIKKLQERDDLVDEMGCVIKELESKLLQAGVPVEAYQPPPSKSNAAADGSGALSSAAAAEADAIAEIGAMKAEMDRLMDENKALKKNASSSSSASPSRSPSKTDNALFKQKSEALEKEKEDLQKQLKTAQQQIAAMKKEVATLSVAQSAALASPLAPPVPTSVAIENDAAADKLAAMQKKLEDAQNARDSALQKVQALEHELAAASSSHAARSSEVAKLSADSSRLEADLQAKLQQQTTHINELKVQLEQQTKALQAKEAAWEEKHAKLKTTAETELNKIKEQAKKAILDLKKKLESSSKDQEIKRKALATLKAHVHKQKAELGQLKMAIVHQNQQVPLLAKQLTDKITQRIQRQTDAMAGVVENYKREMKERKRLFNLVQELKGNIRVLCRVRPISKGEIANGSKAVCKFTPEEITVAGEKGKVKTWEFDRVFDMGSSQEELFAEVKPLVTSILDGYSVCIFAYGQTGSGKTFTMSGPAENPGINTRALQELFQRKVERAKEFQDEITVSIMEIYNEQIRDLLAADASNTNLQVRQGPTGNFVPGLTVIPVQTLDEVFDLIKRGNKNRSTHATDMNEHSSRSHSILSIQLKSVNLVTSSVANGRLFLVDLAGSERLSKTGAEGQRLKEAQNINKSLSALGDVIAARASKAKHVPYRNSSLTYLLQDALGGDSKTLMVACASPVDYNSEETFCTLNFAARARSVEMGKATKNVTQATPTKE